MENFNNTFGFDLSKQHSGMPPNYKPGMDTTGLCKDAKKYKYWQFIGEIQWSITLGRINIIYDAVFLSRYCPSPCKIHISNIQHLYGYLKKYTSTYIMVNTKMPSCDNFKIIEGNWGNLYAGKT